MLALAAAFALPSEGATLFRGQLVGGTVAGIACDGNRRSAGPGMDLYVDGETAIVDLEGRASAVLARHAGVWAARGVADGSDPVELDIETGRVSGVVSAHCRVLDATVRWSAGQEDARVPDRLGERLKAGEAMTGLRRGWQRGLPRAARDAGVLLAAKSSLRGVAEIDALFVEAAEWLLDIAELDAAQPLIEGLAERHRGSSPLLSLAARQLEARLVAYRGDFAKAAAMRVAIAREYDELGAGESADAIRNRAALVAAQSELGDELQAHRDLVAIDELARNRLGADHPVARYTARVRAETALSVGRATEAIDRLERQRSERRSEGSAWEDNQQLQVLAYAYREAGDAWRALAAVERSYLWRVDHLGADNLLTINAAEFLAYCLLQLGRVDEAARIQRRAHEGLERRLGEDSVRTLVARTNLAYAELLEGRPQQAAADLSRVAAGLARQLGETHWRVLGTRVDLAYAHWLSERFDEACHAFAEIARVTDPADMLAREAAMNASYGLARCLLARGDFGNAGHELAIVHAEREKRFGAAGYSTLAALASLAAAQLGSGDTSAARTSLERLVELSEQRRGDESAAPGGGRINFADLVAGREYRAGYRDLAALHARAGRASDAVRISELARARSLGDALSLRDAATASLASQRVRLQLRDLDARRRELEARLALAEPASTAAIRLAVERDEVRARHEELRGTGDEAGVGFDADRLRRLVGSLPRDVAVVGVQQARDATWAYVLRHGVAPFVSPVASDSRWVPLVEALAASHADPRGELIPIWRDASGAWGRSLSVPEGSARHSRAEASAALSKLLLGPLQSRIGDARRLVFVLDGPLQRLPFELLSLHGKRLVERHAVSYAPSLAVLEGWLHTPATRPATTLTAYAVSRFDAGGAPAPGRYANREWSPLPATRREVDAIASQFPAGKAVTITGTEATRDRLLTAARSGELARTRYLHFATHALLDAGAPQWSAIVLRPGTESHGYVTAAELATLDIGAELVTLSACETARGKEVAGEGLFGLPYALSVAGARATLLTLWPVADDATAEFMKRFYGRLAKGASPARALAATKREFIGHPRWNAPFFWAPFVLYGAS